MPDNLRTDRLPGGGDLPPVCPEWVRLGWCTLSVGHDGACLPLPDAWPPRKVSSFYPPEHLRQVA